VGLPRGSTVLIDEQPVSDPTTRLSPGPHVLAVSAPRFNFFTDTIVVRPGETLELTPQLQPIGAPMPPAQDTSPEASPQAPPPALPSAGGHCSPGAGYNADGSCFDERPKPVSPPFVPLPDGVTGAPRPSLLWVKVSAEGRTLDLRRLRSSDDSTFERAARDFVWTVTWHPALKDGAPVEAWTQMLFPPQPD
jgi:outer membrane biosynthesis protein TonB